MLLPAVIASESFKSLFAIIRRTAFFEYGSTSHLFRILIMFSHHSVKLPVGDDLSAIVDRHSKKVIFKNVFMKKFHNFVCLCFYCFSL